MNRRAQTSGNPKSLAEIIGEVVQEIGGQTKLPGDSEIKSARLPDEVRSSAGHNGGRADLMPPSLLRRIELHLPIGINSLLLIVAYRPLIMREYAERDLADPGLVYILVCVNVCTIRSAGRSREEKNKKNPATIVLCFIKREE